MSEGFDSLDELSASWQLESDYPYFRGTASLFVAFVCLILLISLIYKIIKTSSENPRDKPDVCKYCSICCGSRASDYFECSNLCVLPAPLDVCICLYFLGFLTFLCYGYGIIRYGNWIQAQNDLLGFIALIVFSVLVGFVSLCVYLYFYSMLILTISCAGNEFNVSICTKRMHTIFMLTAAICFPIGNIMMEIFGKNFGRNFRIGQILAYTSFACIFLGISHLIVLLVKRLEKVLVNSMSSDVIGSYHSKTRTQIRNDIDNLSKSNIERDAQLIQVITKMLIITVTIISISVGSGIITAYRYYWAEHEKAAKILSLARWCWFTIVNIAFGAFIIYLTIGFNIKLYKYWCRCDRTIHKCVMCCVKRDTMRKVTFAQTQSMNISVDSQTPQSMTQTQTQIVKPTNNKMTSYSSVNSGSRSNGIQLTTQNSTIVEEKDDHKFGSENDIKDLKINRNKLANVPEIEVNNLNNDNQDENKSLPKVTTTDSVKFCI